MMTRHVRYFLLINTCFFIESQMLYINCDFDFIWKINLYEFIGLRLTNRSSMQCKQAFGFSCPIFSLNIICGVRFECDIFCNNPIHMLFYVHGFLFKKTSKFMSMILPSVPLYLEAAHVAHLLDNRTLRKIPGCAFPFCKWSPSPHTTPV